MTAMGKEPKASPAKAAYHQKQLRKLFARANDKQFLQMVWAVDALRSGRADAAARLLPPWLLAVADPGDLCPGRRSRK